MLGVDEFIVAGVFKALEQVGVELRPPHILQQQGKFPDCSCVLQEFRPTKRTHPSELQRYVRLCRLTAIAWVTWAGMAFGIAFCIMSLIYHLRLEGGIHAFVHQFLFLGIADNQHLAAIRCIDLILFVIASIFVASVAYSMTLGFIGRAAMALSKNGHSRSVAAS
jgi:hypothetical protein